MDRCVARKFKLYPNAEVILDIPNPNSMNIWHRYCETYGHRITRNGIDFRLNDGYSERRMLRHMKQITQSRLEEDDLE